MLGEELRKARKKAGLSQERLGFAAGLDRSYVSQLENDKKSPTMDAFFRICDALGVRPSVLIAKVERSRAKSAVKTAEAKSPRPN